MPTASLTDVLTDKDEAFPEEPDKSLGHELPPGVDLDDLDVDEEPVHSIPHLVAEERSSDDLARLSAKMKALADLNTRTLIVKIETQPDPLILWALHLGKRGFIRPSLPTGCDARTLHTGSRQH